MKLITIPLTKVDEEKRLVYGTAALEQVDKSNEIFDYAGSKPLFEKWSGDQHLSSAGKSYGNVREMHEKSAAGKITEPLGFDDVAKTITVCAKVVDDGAWQKVLEGVYTGFSIGGAYTKRWADETIKTAKRYIAAPNEISLVDNPCMPGATFEFIKSAGGTEKRGFAPAVGTFEKDEAQLSQSLYKVCESLGGSEPGASAHSKALRVMKKAEELKVDASGFAKAYVQAYGGEIGEKLEKSLYDVTTVADVLMQLNYCQSCLAYEAEYEGDGSEIPAKLKEVMTMLGAILVDLATEETKELLAATKTTADQIKKETIEMKKFWELYGGTVEKLTGSEDPEVKKMATHLKEIGKHVDGIQAAHDKMGEHLDALAGKDDSGGDDKDGAEKLAKAVKKVTAITDGRIEKLEAGQVQTVEALGNINESFKELLKKLPAPSNVAITHPVQKTADGAPAGDPPAIDPKDPGAALKLMKRVHEAGPTLTVLGTGK